MNIYFACSITGGRELEPVYQHIVAALIDDGHVIPTSHLAQTEALEQERRLSPQDVYQRDVNWIKDCDVLIAEVSVPSHGVGYEIGFALNGGKPVLCLYQQGRNLSKMISGNPNPALTIKAYAAVDKAISQTREYLRSNP
jgi:2'-deoxynucleoside 5'-phosphate N-hydrolase